MAGTLSRDEIEEVQDVFELFSFWDSSEGDKKKEGEVDAFKTGDMLYCLGFNPTQEVILKHGGSAEKHKKGHKVEDFLSIYSEVTKLDESGTFNDFNEAFKTFDREGQGFISSAELRHVLSALGDKLSDEEVEFILKETDTKENLEGNFKYGDFIGNVLKGSELES